MRIGYYHALFTWVFFFGMPAAAQQPVGPVEAVACAPLEPATAAVYARGLIHITRDGGATWSGTILGDLPESEEEEAVADLDDPDYEWDEDGDHDRDEEDIAEGHGGSRGPERVLLAVADDGRFAVFGNGILILGGHRRGPPREIELGAVAHGMRFDAHGNLWIATCERLLEVDPRGTVRMFPVAAAGAPARGPDGTALVPAADAVLQVSAGAPVTELLSLSVAGSRAVAWSATRPGLMLVASRGRLRRVSPADGTAEDGGRVFGDARELLVDGGGGVFARREDGTWHRRGAAGWRRTEAVDMDVDALGRRWVATLRELVTPAGPRPAAVAAMPPTMRVTAWPFDEVGPPPCEPALVFPVPRVDLFFDIGHRSRRKTALPEELDELQLRSELRVGLRLTANFGVADRSACLPRFEDWARRQEARRRRLEGLHRAHALSAARLAAASAPGEIGRGLLETERLAELISLMSGVEAGKDWP